MKMASRALKTYLANRSEAPRATAANVFVADLFTFVVGGGRIVLNERHILESTTTTVVPPILFGMGAKFYQDLGVRKAGVVFNPAATYAKGAVVFSQTMLFVSLSDGNIGHTPGSQVSTGDGSAYWGPGGVDADAFQFTTGSPGAGQYSVDESTGIYTFNASDEQSVLNISYVFQVGATYGLIPPTVIRLCTGDRNLTLWGKTFYAGGYNNNPGGAPYPTIERGKSECKVGMEVAQQDIELKATADCTIDGVPILARAVQGYFDGAATYVQRVFMGTWGKPIGAAALLEDGVVILFNGSVAPVEGGRSSVKMTIKAQTELLDIMMPRTLYQPGCRWNLFDAGCGLNPFDFRVNGVEGSPVVVIANANNSRTTFQTNLGNDPSFGPPIAPPATFALTLGNTSGGGSDPTSRMMWVVYTWIGRNGETTASPFGTYNLNPNDRLTVTFPSPWPPVAANAVGWNLYVGMALGDYQLQDLGVDGWHLDSSTYTEPSGGATQGIHPPLINNSGYFDQGVIAFLSGANAGVSRTVSQYLLDTSTGNMTVTVVPPLSDIPAGGDLFQIFPGCDKSWVTCGGGGDPTRNGTGKFNNAANFGGFPFIPDPAQVI